MPSSFFVVTYQGPQDRGPRVMGFKTEEAGAEELVSILGQGAAYGEMEGDFPHDEYSMAMAVEEYLLGLENKGDPVP